MMKLAWHSPTPIKESYKQLRNTNKFAKRGNEEISDSQLIRYAYDNVFKTGLFNKACKHWRDTKQGDKTWINFQ